jgi:ionotropic glutamate receptor
MGGVAQLVVTVLLATAAAASAPGARPSEVAVGALFTYDSTIGRAAQLAIELAVDDVNADAKVLAGTKLNLMPMDTNCSGFLGTMKGCFFSPASSGSFLVHACVNQGLGFSQNFLFSQMYRNTYYGQH